MIETPLVQIIILNWNGKTDTLECLRSLHSLQYKNFGITVVDNGSIDGSVEAIRTEFEHICIIETGENLGFAGGNNTGIKHALQQGADYVLVLNNDTYVDDLLLDRLVISSREYSDAVMLGPAILFADTDSQLWFAGAKWSNDKFCFDFPLQEQNASKMGMEPYDTEYICGAAMFFHRSIPEKLGLMDERFFLVWEESDWCFRLRRAGIKCLIVPEAKIWHKIGASFGSESSPLRVYYSYRNRLLWSEKNLGYIEWFKVVRHSLRPFFPKCAVSAQNNVNFTRKLVWAADSWLKTRQSLFLKTKRRAFLDYLFRNFGECPKPVMHYHSQWLKSQQQENF